MARRRSSLAPVLWVPASLALGLLLLPLVALIVRAPWATLPSLLAQPAVAQALGLSLATAAAATSVCLLLGIPLALVLARSAAWPAVPRRLLRSLISVPLVLPPVVGGVALLLLLGRRGLIGEWLPFSIPFTPLAVVIAQVFVSMPFLVIAVEGALRASDRRIEVAAATLGATRLTVLRRITLPLVAPGIASGALLCFTRSLGEFGATITFAGSFPGTTQTLPISTYLLLQTDPDAAIALSLVLMVVSVAVLLGLRDRWVPGVLS
ncbi:molybdate ABC transporter permease subunit [Microcella daejeonensis]|uniref:Molybdenum transport system permease n=1 Tax=Microcella daejeonensis TaxID=2994971 RepID=A0A9E8S882_9MICO|nr:molybdate ABC transporter permease subunit [Microcella daejeonensis]WAB80978.1 molybdate ABC transporter permease subunit [Microcella daejeonensis]